MECSVCAVVQDQTGSPCLYVKLKDGRRLNLGLPPEPRRCLEKIPGFRAIARLCEPVTHLLRKLYSMLELYYLASERPALLALHTSQREIFSYLGATLRCLYTLGCATSSAISSLSIAPFTLNRGPLLGTKNKVFKYGYFGHSMAVTLCNHNRGMLLVTSNDKGAVNVSAGGTKAQGLLQLTHIYLAASDAEVTSNALGYGGNNETEAFVSCVTLDPTQALGATMMVGYSNGAVEIWKETVCISDLNEVLYEAVAQCHVPSYPFYCAFGPCGEIALLLTVDDMYMMEWTGSSLVGIKLVDGSSADFWTSTRTKVLAAEWLNSHELMAISECGHLWLSRRSEMGYWQRIAQYILFDEVPGTLGLTSWISRIQHDGRCHLYVKMCGSHQLMQLKWDKKSVPVLTAIDLPMKDIGLMNRPNKDGLIGSENLKVADFALEPHSSLIAVVVSDRSMVCVYVFPSMRFVHVIDPPKPYLKVGGIKFVNAGEDTRAYLAIKWVEMSLEIFQEKDDFEIDHKLPKRRGTSAGRLTMIYTLTEERANPSVWQDQTLAEILNGSNSVARSHLKGPKNSIYRRREKLDASSIPSLSILKPSFPERLLAGPRNTAMYEDAFAHRNQVFGKHLQKSDNRIFPMEGKYKTGVREHLPLGEYNVYGRGKSSRDLESDTPVYSMEEFTRLKGRGFK